ncbi:PAS domain S-box protein [Saccharibacillus sp. JS10]|nr:PAS domain S-box protein [Saccharibacillus sp. JS10]
MYRSIFEHHPDAIYVMNKEGHLIYANPATEVITGYTFEELQTLKLRDLSANREEGRVSSFVHAMNTENKLTFKLEIVSRAGKQIILSITHVAIEQNGERLGFYAIATDITEQEQQSRKWREHEKLYRSLFDYNPAGILSFDTKGHCLSVNPQMEAMTGYSESEVSAQPYSDFFTPESSLLLEQRFEYALSGHSGNFEAQILAQDGLPIDVNMTSLPIIVDGQVLGVYMIALDITDWKKQMQRSREQTDQYTSILNAVSEGIFEINREGRSVFINQAGARMLGYEIEEFRNVYNHDLIHHSHSDGSVYPIEECPIHLSIREGVAKEVTGEVFWRKDGTSFLVQYRVNPLFEEGEPAGAVVVFKDITSEEEIIRQKNEAQRALSAKTRFLSLMSHEIRTPLGGVLGMAELMQSTEMTPDQRDYMEVLLLSARGLQSIVDRILDFNAAESGVLHFEKKEFAVQRLIEEEVGAFYTQAQAAEVNLSLKIAENFPSKLIGDPGKLRQILVALVGNAIKFTPKGEIEVIAEYMIRPLQDLEGLTHYVLKVEIRDTGIGIPIDKIGLLFQPFSQIQTLTLDRRYEGTGLGLAICKRWIERMGGAIWAESEEGVGSVFSFTLPMLGKR